MVVVRDIVTHTSRDGDTSSIMYLEIGDTPVGIHEGEGDRDVGDGLAAVVDDTECDGVFLKIDTATATRRANLGNGDIVGQRVVDADIDVRIVAGAVARAEAVEVVGGVVEILRRGTPVGRTVIVVIAVVEEGAVGGVASPADDTGFTLSGPQVAVGTVVDHGVMCNGHIGCVVRGNVDIVGGVVVLFDVVLCGDECPQFDCNVEQGARRVEVGLISGRHGYFTLCTHRQCNATEGLDIQAAASGEVGEALVGGLVAVVVIAKGEGKVAGEVLLTSILQGVAQRHIEHATAVGVADAVDSHRDNLQVIGGIDKHFGGVDIVPWTCIDRSVTHT